MLKVRANSAAKASIMNNESRSAVFVNREAEKCVEECAHKSAKRELDDRENERRRERNDEL
jgi:hypothetical protein